MRHSQKLAAAVVTSMAVAIGTIISATKPKTVEREVAITKIVDGDTIEISAPEMPDGLPKRLLLRVQGVDTPEKGGRAKCAQEAHKAQLARVYLEQMIAASKKKRIVLLSWDKYGGRVLGDIELDSGFISDLMIEHGHAIRYNGEKKTHDWCR